jgi:site-specific recombinase XerD
MRVYRQQVGATISVALLDDQGHAIPEVAGFLRHLGARGCSPNTLSAYTYDLAHFYRFLGRNGLNVDAFSPAESLAFLEYLCAIPSRQPAQRLDLVLATTISGKSATRLAPASINRMFAAVSSFYEYLILSGRWAVENPIQQRPDPALARVSGVPVVMAAKTTDMTLCARQGPVCSS